MSDKSSYSRERLWLDAVVGWSVASCAVACVVWTGDARNREFAESVVFLYWTTSLLALGRKHLALALFIGAALSFGCALGFASAAVRLPALGAAVVADVFSVAISLLPRDMGRRKD